MYIYTGGLNRCFSLKLKVCVILMMHPQEKCFLLCLNFFSSSSHGHLDPFLTLAKVSSELTFKFSELISFAAGLNAQMFTTDQTLSWMVICLKTGIFDVFNHFCYSAVLQYSSLQRNQVQLQCSALLRAQVVTKADVLEAALHS